MADHEYDEKASKPIAVVTGVYQGVGLGSIKKLIELGYTVIGCDIKPLNQLQKSFPNHDFSTVDVSDPIQVEKWSSRVIRKYGSPDFVFLNAAMGTKVVLIEDCLDDIAHKMCDINIKGVMYCIKYFIESMKKNRNKPSKIIAMSSTSGREGSPKMSVYCATKWAVEGLMVSISKEIPSHMMVCAYNPGSITTTLLCNLIPELKGNIQKAINLGAIGPNKWADVCIPHMISLNRTLHNGKPIERPNWIGVMSHNWDIWMTIKKQVQKQKAVLDAINKTIQFLEQYQFSSLPGGL